MSAVSPLVPSPQPVQHQTQPQNPQNWLQTLPQTWQSTVQGLPQAINQNLNLNQMTQGLNTINRYGAEELLPLLAPRAAVVAPWLTPGYVGLDVWNQAHQTYMDSADLSQHQRLQKTAIQTGDTALFHLLGTIGIPLLLIRPINRTVHRLLEKPNVPPLLSKHPGWVSAAAVIGSMIALSQPIRVLTNWILDWTYRPLLEKKRREEVQQLWQAQQARLDAQLQHWQPSTLMSRWSASV